MGEAKAGSEIVSYIRRLALEASGDDGQFAKLVDKLREPALFSLVVRKEMEQALRRLPGGEDRTVGLADLITQARDGELLSQEKVDLAHLLRKQGNIMAHEGAEPRTFWARCLLSLFAAAILWPDLAPDGRA